MLLSLLLSNERVPQKLLLSLQYLIRDILRPRVPLLQWLFP